VDVETLGEALGLSRSRTFALIQDGTLPRVGRARYDLVRCCRCYIESLREERGDADALALRRVKRERAELELSVRREEVQRDSDEPLVPVSAAVEFFSECVRAFWPTIIAMSARIAPRLADVQDPKHVFAILDDELRATLAEAHRVGCRKLGVPDPDGGERAA
jgi:hypothetical protein